jgi:hypothetical protein
LENQGINTLVFDTYAWYSGLSPNSVSSINVTPVGFNKVQVISNPTAGV